MNTRNRRQPPNKAQAPAYTGKEPDASPYRQIMDKYSEMISEKRQTIARAQSAAADAVVWLLTAGNVALPAVSSYLRNACVLKKAESFAGLVAGTSGRIPLGLRVLLLCASLTIGLSWIWWLCKKSLGWLAYRILLSVLVNVAVKLIPLPASWPLEQNLAITIVASLAQLGTASLVAGAGYIIYNLASRYRLKRDD